MYVYVYMYVYVHVYRYNYASMYICICLYVCMYVCMYVISGSGTLSVKSRLPFIEGFVLEGYFIIVEFQS
jgi:hypothetical protein